MSSSASDQNERFIGLYAQHERRLRRYISALVPVPEDVDDILQETAIALLRKFDEYEESRPFFNWACRFAFYQVLQHRKQVQRRARRFSDEVVELLAKEYQEAQAAGESRRRALMECLRELSSADRALIRMRYASDEAIGALAQRINEPAAKLYRSLARIRRLLAICVSSRVSLEDAR